MNLGILSLHISISGCRSLKDKRSHLKHYLARVHNEFNVSSAEVGLNDNWVESELAIVFISNEQGFTNRILDKILDFTEINFQDIEILENHMEFIQI